MIVSANASAAYAGFGNGDVTSPSTASLATLLGLSQSTVATLDFIVFELNGSVNDPVETSSWTFTDGTNTATIHHNFASPQHVGGNISNSAFATFFGYTTPHPVGDHAFLAFDLDGLGLDLLSPNLKVTITGMGNGAADNPDIDAMALLPNDRPMRMDWAKTLDASANVTYPARALGAPDGEEIVIVSANASAAYSGFGSGASSAPSMASLATLLGLGQSKVASLDFIVFELNGSLNDPVETSTWTFSDGVNSAIIAHDFNSPGHVGGNISNAAFAAFFGYSPPHPVGDHAFLAFDLDGLGLDLQSPNLKVTITGMGNGAVDNPDIDAMAFLSSNRPPQADISVDQLTAIGTNAQIRLDGTGSSDPEDANNTLIYRWTVDSVVVSDGPAATIDIVLPISIALGNHSITLRVTDPAGAFDETSTTVTVHPAQLSVMEIGEAEVGFQSCEREVEISGEIGLPFGVDFSVLSPKVRGSLVVGGAAIFSNTDVTFSTEGSKKKEWKFESGSATSGITKFRIDWKGMRYRFRERGFPIKLGSKVITSSGTVMGVKIDAKEISGPFTMAIGTLGTVSFDGNGAVTAATIPYDVKKSGKKIQLTLAGPLQSTTVITFSGSLSKVLSVADDLKASIGRFHLQAKFGSTLLPLGSATTPRSLKLTMQIGTQGYAGCVSLNAAELEVDGDEWEFDEDDDS